MALCYLQASTITSHFSTFFSIFNSAGALGVCIFLHYMGHSDEKLGETSADDHRNTIIVYVNENGNESIPHLQGLPDVTLVDKACSLAGFDSITVKLEKTDEEAIMERIDYENMSVGDSVVVYKPMDSSVWEQMDPKLEIRTLGVVTKVTVTKNLTGPSFDTTARAAVFQFNNNSDISNGSVDMSILSTKAGMTSNQTYAGFDASANLMEATAGPIDAKLGVGVSTGIGLKDDSLGVKVGGTGFTVGRKMGISVMDNEFSVDFGKLFFGW